MIRRRRTAAKDDPPHDEWDRTLRDVALYYSETGPQDVASAAFQLLDLYRKARVADGIARGEVYLGST